MIERKRTPLSATQRVEVWRRWKAGESLHAIGCALDKDHVVVHLLLKRHGGIAPARSQTPRDAAALVNLGPWVGDGATQELQHSHRCESLFLRSAESLAARHEREHQRAATTVLAQESRSVSLHAIGPGQNSPASESTAARDLGF